MGKSEKGRNDKGLREGGRIHFNFATTLSILSAVYVFTHREQKSISPSLYNEARKNGLVIFVVVILILTMITGHTLVSNIDSLMQKQDTISSHPLHISKVLVFKIGMWIFSIGIALMVVMDLIKYLFTSMNANRMLKNSIRLVSEHLDTLNGFYRTNRYNGLLAQLYRSLHHNVESIFQYLKYLGDNNMNRDFDEDIDSLSEIIWKLKNPDKQFDIDNVASFLLEKDKEHFLIIYNSLLRNTLSLILHLYKNHHFNKGKKLTTLYFSLFIEGEASLKQHFTYSLNEFLDSLDASNERQLKHFLTGLKNLPEDSTLIIYKNLMQRLIIKGNIGLLTTVVYDFKNHVIDEDKSKTKSMINPMLKAISNQNELKMKQNAIIILLQLLIKAIEISSYGIAGFLVKYMVTNFQGKDIDEAYQSMKQNPTSFTSILEVDNEVLEEDFDITLVGVNIETFEYCCKKLSILLYGQQQFAIKEKLWFMEEKDGEHFINIGLEFKNCTYSRYVMKKVKSAASKYGLLFFEDSSIMQMISNEINDFSNYIDTPSSEKQTVLT